VWKLEWKYRYGDGSKGRSGLCLLIVRAWVAAKTPSDLHSIPTSEYEKHSSESQLQQTWRSYKAWRRARSRCWLFWISRHVINIWIICILVLGSLILLKDWTESLMIQTHVESRQIHSPFCLYSRLFYSPTKPYIRCKYRMPDSPATIEVAGKAWSEEATHRYWSPLDWMQSWWLTNTELECISAWRSKVWDWLLFDGLEDTWIVLSVPSISFQQILAKEESYMFAIWFASDCHQAIANLQSALLEFYFWTLVFQRFVWNWSSYLHSFLAISFYHRPFKSI